MVNVEGHSVKMLTGTSAGLPGGSTWIGSLKGFPKHTLKLTPPWRLPLLLGWPCCHENCALNCGPAFKLPNKKGWRTGQFLGILGWSYATSVPLPSKNVLSSKEVCTWELGNEV